MCTPAIRGPGRSRREARVEKGATWRCLQAILIFGQLGALAAARRSCHPTAGEGVGLRQGARTLSWPAAPSQPVIASGFR